MVKCNLDIFVYVMIDIGELEIDFYSESLNLFDEFGFKINKER